MEVREELPDGRTVVYSVEVEEELLEEEEDIEIRSSRLVSSCSLQRGENVETVTQVRLHLQ